MPSFAIVTDTPFTGANTAVGAAGTSTGAGGGCLDHAGNVYHIVSAVLVNAGAISPLQGGVPYGVLERPSSEAIQDQQTAVIVPANIGNTVFAGVRWTGAGATGYFAGLTNGGTPFLWKFTNGAILGIGATTTVGSWVGTNRHKLTINAVGSSSTVISVTLTDLDAATTVATISATDSSSPFTSGVGAMGFPNGGAATEFITYTGQFGIAAPVVTGTTTTTITLTGSAAFGGSPGYTYQWYWSNTTSNFTPGAGNIIGGQTSLVLTHTPGGTNQTVNYYKLVATDTLSALAISPAVPAVTGNPTTVIAMVGDSITAGDFTYLATAWSQVVNNYPATFLNYGYSGVKAVDWANAVATPGSLFGTMGATWSAITAAWVAAGVTDVHIMLGANDAGVSGQTSTGAYLTAMQALCAGCLAVAGVTTVHLSDPSLAKSIGAGTNDDDTSLVISNLYRLSCHTITNGTTIKAGDRNYWQASLINPSDYGDQLHPAYPTGALPLVTGWCAAIAINKGFLAAPAGGGGTLMARSSEGGYSS